MGSTPFPPPVTLALWTGRHADEVPVVRIRIPGAVVMVHGALVLSWGPILVTFQVLGILVGLVSARIQAWSEQSNELLPT